LTRFVNSLRELSANEDVSVVGLHVRECWGKPLDKYDKIRDEIWGSTFALF